MADFPGSMSGPSPAVARFMKHNAAHPLMFYRWIARQGLVTYTFADGSTMNLADDDHKALKQHNIPIHWGNRENAA